MSEVRTSLGTVYELERHLPSLGWKPRLRGKDDGSWLDVPDFGGGDDLGIFAIIGLIVLAVLLVIVLVPLLLFVAELALVIALIIPVTIFALVIGLKQHTVILRRKADGVVVDQRSVHGVLGTVRAGRALKAAAHAGAYQ